MRKLASVAVIVSLLSFAARLRADEFSEHFVSASAGVVNYLEGSPRIFFGGAKLEGKGVAARTQVKAGDVISTGEQDRLELLLNPGSYLRIGSSSELRILGTKFEAMRFELVRGSAIVESATFDRKVHALTVTTSSGDISLVKGGLYRLEVQPSAVYLAVHQGKAKWARDGVEIATLKSGRRFVLAAPAPGGEVQFAKLEKKDADDLDRWSRRRAEFLVAANNRLSPWLMSSLLDRYPYRQRGGWLFNPYFGCHTFVPFDATFGSPYGFRYATFLPVRVYRTPDYGWAGADSGGYGRISSPSTTYGQRSATVSAPSAPAARMESGRAEQDHRSSTAGSIRNR